MELAKIRADIAQENYFKLLTFYEDNLEKPEVEHLVDYIRDYVVKPYGFSKPEYLELGVNLKCSACSDSSGDYIRTSVFERYFSKVSERTKDLFDLEYVKLCKVILQETGRSSELYEEGIQIKTLLLEDPGRYEKDRQRFLRKLRGSAYSFWELSPLRVLIYKRSIPSFLYSVNFFHNISLYFSHNPFQIQMGENGNLSIFFSDKFSHSLGWIWAYQRNLEIMNCFYKYVRFFG